MRKTLGLAALGAVLAAGLSLVGGTATAGPPQASVIVGHAYVNDNAVGSNTVAAFDRHADGSLTPIPGSPFPVGGAGLGAGLGSQGAIQLRPDGRFLLAVDGGSNYTGFFLTPAGRLIPLPGTTVPVPEGSGVGDVLFNSTGDRLVGTRDNPSLIDSFTVRPNGRLVAAPGSPFAGQGLGQIGAEFRPTNPSELYVSNAHNGPELGTVSAFHVSRNGVLRSIGDSPVPDGQTAPCWVEISHDGKYLFAINTGSGNLSRYAIGRDGSLSLIGTSAPFTNRAGAADARLSPDGKFLFVTGGRGLVVSGFAVNGGDVTELQDSPTALPSGTAPTGIVVV